MEDEVTQDMVGDQFNSMLKNQIANVVGGSTSTPQLRLTNKGKEF